MAEEKKSLSKMQSFCLSFFADFVTPSNDENAGSMTSREIPGLSAQIINAAVAAVVAAAVVSATLSDAVAAAASAVAAAAVSDTVATVVAAATVSAAVAMTKRCQSGWRASEVSPPPVNIRVTQHHINVEELLPCDSGGES